MGTRSTIALEYADGSVEQVYCHWDGYLSHNGRILTDHYTDPHKLQELLALGGFSSLKETVEETKLQAYHFWRGEDLTIERYKDFFNYQRECPQEEYNYILKQEDGQAVWRVCCYATDDTWVTLDQAAAMEELMNDED